MGNGLKARRQHPSFLYEPLFSPPFLEDAENEKLRVFSAKELKKATNRFRKDRVVTSHDGSVQTFYKGYINDTTPAPSRTKTKVAVSVIECLQHSPPPKHVWKISKEEAESLGEIHHPNLVKLLGYCYEDIKSLLVFEYSHKGSLHDHIFGKEETLPWETRVKIAIGVAEAIAFLHSIKKIPMHQELHMHNIMLDEQYNAKLLYLDSKKKFIGDNGTFLATTYMPLEYAMIGHAGVITDVFTYGVILLELFTGSKGGVLCQSSLDIRTRSFRKIIDPRLEGDYPTHAAKKMGILIQRCTMGNWKVRPSMKHVLDVLNYIACKY
ncbi:hypothetical protein F2Q70_00014226 [Brassica cretica]|uniref:Protein kinase domain-containing protein n=1 Tax=Brassica cretica TaxID=69181 RepID=A0A8S9HSQ3_BRACR|nr:hypothetical protein F2Q70_00014226 [Brassica cretica]